MRRTRQMEKRMGIYPNVPRLTPTEPPEEVEET